MNITQLQYFQAVCKYGSTVKAAEAMYVSQPSISNAINKLEEEYGLTLFNRESNRLVLTDDGKIFLEKTNKFVLSAEEFNMQIRRLKAKDEIHLSIPPVGDLGVTREIMNFRKENPELRIKVYEDAQAEGFEKLVSGRRDFILTIIDDIDVEATEEIEAIPLRYIDLKLCVNKNSPLAEYKSISAEQIGNTPLVMMKNYYYQNILLSNRFRKLGLEPNIILYSGLFTTLRKYVELNYAVGFAFGSTSAKNETLKYIPLVPPVSATFGIVYRKSALLNHNINKMMNYIIEHMKS